MALWCTFICREAPSVPRMVAQAAAGGALVGGLLDRGINRGREPLYARSSPGGRRVSVRLFSNKF